MDFDDILYVDTELCEEELALMKLFNKTMHKNGAIIDSEIMVSERIAGKITQDIKLNPHKYNFGTGIVQISDKTLLFKVKSHRK